MKAENFIKQKYGWDEKSRGMFDYNGIVTLLNDFQNESTSLQLELKILITKLDIAQKENTSTELIQIIISLCEIYKKAIRMNDIELKK